LHWYAGTQSSPTAHSLRAWYLQHDPHNGKAYHRGYADWHIPAEILGFLAGIILARSWMWRAELVFWALFLSGGIIAVHPFYLAFFPDNRLDMPHSHIGMIAGGIVAFVIGTLHCGFFIAIGRVLTAYFIERKSRRTVGSKHDTVA